MLMRSASTPVLSSFMPHSREPSPDSEISYHNPRSVTVAASSPVSFSSGSDDYSGRMKKMTRASSESYLRELSVPKRKPDFGEVWNGVPVEEGEASTKSLNGEGVSWGNVTALEQGCRVKARDAGLSVLVGGGVGGAGGKICGGGDGSDGGDDERSGFWDWDTNRGNDGTDVYYQKMIGADPGNPLFLGNYAAFLKEVRGDLAKAEEYCGRAILAKPNDGNLLSVYGDLVWQNHKDASRADGYFNQAVEAAPDDCYVMASYARFLWEAEEEEEEEESVKKNSHYCYLHGAEPLIDAY